MGDDTFVCKKCGDLLRDPLIATYRAVISSGGDVSGSIKCARCGSIYLATEIIKQFSRQSSTLEVIPINKKVLCCFWAGIGLLVMIYCFFLFKVNMFPARILYAIIIGIVVGVFFYLTSYFAILSNNKTISKLNSIKSNLKETRKD